MWKAISTNCARASKKSVIVYQIKVFGRAERWIVSSGEYYLELIMPGRRKLDKMHLLYLLVIRSNLACTFSNLADYDHPWRCQAIRTRRSSLVGLCARVLQSKERNCFLKLSEDALGTGIMLHLRCLGLQYRYLDYVYYCGLHSSRVLAFSKQGYFADAFL